MGRQGGCVSGARTPAHTRGHRGRPRCPRLAAAAAAPRLTTSPSPQLCQDGVGRCLLAAAAAVPGGVLAFFPSYSLLGRLVDRWRGTGAWRALGAATTPVVEPRGSGPGFADALAEYYAAVEGGGRAMFLAVCRGKASRQGALMRGGRGCGGAAGSPAHAPAPPPHRPHPPALPPPLCPPTRPCRRPRAWTLRTPAPGRCWSLACPSPPPGKPRREGGGGVCVEGRAEGGGGPREGAAGWRSVPTAQPTLPTLPNPFSLSPLRSF